MILENMSNDAVLYSVDISKDYYKDNNKETGFVAKENLTPNLLSKWKTFFGFDIVDCIKDIGTGIDFLILDTTHVLPGEFLSFLVVFNYLKLNCVVVLHDTALNYYLVCRDKENAGEYAQAAYSNGLLLSAVVSSNKMLLPNRVSNIGAFVFEELTKQSAISIFLALLTPWRHLPPQILLDKYFSFIESNFSRQCYVYFVETIKLQRIYQKIQHTQRAQLSALNKSKHINTAKA